MSNPINQLLDQALAFHRKGQLSDAEKTYKKILKAQKKNPTALHFLGVLRHQQGRNLESKKLIRRALNIVPGDMMAMSNLGTTYSALKQYDEAVKLFSKVLASQPNNFQILTNRGNAYQALGRHSNAIDDYRKALALNPRIFEAARNLGQSLYATGQNSDAESVFKSCVELAPQYAPAYLSLANFYRENKQLNAAKINYEKALEFAPSNPDIHCDYAITIRDLGELSKAADNFKKAVELNPQLGRAWRGYAGLMTFETLADIKPMQEALKITGDKNAQLHFHFALGKAMEDMGRFEEAFTHFGSANRLQAGFGHYRVRHDLAFLENLKSEMSGKAFEANSGKGPASNRPIFVLGMPRSGTSLVEQILASHSQVFGAGELDDMAKEINRVLPPVDDLDYTQSLNSADPTVFRDIGMAYLAALDSRFGAEADYIVDKMPMNFLHIGIIALALPHAKIIHCKRDPMDNCLSIYKNHLPAKGHGYAVKLSSLGKYYKGYEQLMEHWKACLGDRLYDIQYEKLATHPEAETKALLQACGLDFEAACLSPHETKRIVSTLSAAQVRQPIYKKSIGGWKNYADQLEPLRREISPE